MRPTSLVEASRRARSLRNLYEALRAVDDPEAFDVTRDQIRDLGWAVEEAEEFEDLYREGLDKGLNPGLARANARRER